MEYPSNMDPPKYTPMDPPRVLVGPPLFVEYSMQVACRNCHKTINTNTQPENGDMVLLVLVILLVVFFPLFWIPLVARSCKDVSHYCPSCGAKLGTFKRL